MRRPEVPDQLRHRPFSFAQALEAGLSPTALQSAPWRQLLRGVWVHKDVEDTRETRLAAVKLLLPPYAVICGLTAAWAHGADVLREDDLEIHVGFPKGKRLRPRPGLRVCQETLEPTDWVEIDGVRVTTPLRTAFDCLRWLRFAERLVVADALTHAELVTVVELRRYFAGKKRLRNLRRGEALVDLVEPATESPMETRLRFLMIDAGLPRPHAQYEVRGPGDRFIARVDLAYPHLEIAIEYDGAWHWKQRRKDERRWAALRAQGWLVLVYDADDVFKTPTSTVAEIRRGIRSRSRAA